jgi:predicted nuclease of predicted toxin-antitoxin system
MKFLVDAQLPRRLATQLCRNDLDAIHTLDLPLGNRTTDLAINELSVAEQYVVVTKDSGFVESFVLHGKPWKLLLVSTGNIRNSDLESLFQFSMERMIEGFKTVDFIELSSSKLIFHT